VILITYKKKELLKRDVEVLSTSLFNSETFDDDLFYILNNFMVSRKKL
jgi:hypothetical protein